MFLFNNILSKMENKITIITPTYNRANTLTRLFVSLNNQTYKDFIWVILDDGSTDNTEAVVQKFIDASRGFEIIYKKDKNRHKFLTVLEGIKMVKSPYFMIVDSDDALPENSLEILINEVENIPFQDNYISVMGLSAYENGEVVGNKYPNEGFDGSILEMRHKYKVRGDKFGIFITKSYHREIKGKNFSKYEGKGYIPQNIIFNDYDARGIKTRFINKVVRYYLIDENDEESISNTRWMENNLYGLAEGHLSVLNSYGNQLFSYPKTLIRNIIGYQTYALKNRRTIFDLLIQIKYPSIKIFGFLIFPLSYLYFLIKK